MPFVPPIPKETPLLSKRRLELYSTWTQLQEASMRIFWETVQKARREHFCDYCGHWIMPGEEYKRFVWIPDSGRFIVMKSHFFPHCPPDPFAEAEVEPEPIALAVSYAVRMEAVQRVLINGKVETQFEPRFVPVTIPEPEPDPADFGDDIPF